MLNIESNYKSCTVIKFKNFNTKITRQEVSGESIPFTIISQMKNIAEKYKELQVFEINDFIKEIKEKIASVICIEVINPLNGNSIIIDI